MQKVINTHGFGTTFGHAVQITLPNGKFYYTGISSMAELSAKEKGLKTKYVRYFGACIYYNINDRAHEEFPIQIEEVSVADFIDKIATEEEYFQFVEQGTA